MTTTERKQLLLQRLLAVDDDRVLEEIEACLNKKCVGNMLYFSSDLREKIDGALKQMREGEVYTTEDMEKKLSRWSGK